MTAPARHGAGSDGFTVIELMVAMAIMLVVVTTVFRLADPANGAFRAQPEVSDMQQRMRVATTVLQQDLMMAGAGTYSGSMSGPLVRYFAPILPHRVGAIGADGPLTHFTDRLTILYVPATASQTSLASPMPLSSSPVTVASDPGCPTGQPVCGFKVGTRAMVFDDTGAYDVFTVTRIEPAAAQLDHGPPNPALSKAYSPAEHARVTQVESHTYYYDGGAAQLHHYDGWVTDVPLVDDVVGMEIQYYGDAAPPAAPRPAPGQSNCLFDAQGTPRLPALNAPSGSLVALPRSLLVDGPLCGSQTSGFDADLYRVRKVAVRLRVEAASSSLRGHDARLFLRPGTASSGSSFVPDFELTFDVTPRNLNFAR
ncbi:MAG: prepilin-type N-terminal cleavage/methylation domain-containing protein [Vicinamibacterales bacterium]